MNTVLRICLVASAICASLTSSWAINKCTSPDGHAVFQDTPCAGKGEKLDVRPASGNAAALTAPKAAAAPMTAPEPGSGGVVPADQKPMTEAQRIEAEVAKSQKARRKRDLEVVAIPNKRLAIAQHTAACDRHQAQLQAKKRSANNNLAGAVWEQSISEEMSAAARECGTRSRQLLAEMDSLRQECAAVGCVPEGQ